MKLDVKDMLHFCTYFDSNYLSRGLALYFSLTRHCASPFTLWILCFDDVAYQTLKELALSNIRLIRLNEFEEDDKELLSIKSERTAVEYYWTCTPSLPLYIFNNNKNVDAVAYLDADLFFYSDPKYLYEKFDGYSILIIGHRYSPKHQHLAETSGMYNVGALLFRKDDNGIDCLVWWRQCCIEWCYNRSEEGKFGDQKYLDDWPKRYKGVLVLNNKGVNLAPWNISQYHFFIRRNQPYVDEDRVIFYHYHAFRRVSKRIIEPAPRTYHISSSVIKYLYASYSEELLRIEKKIRQEPDESESHGLGVTFKRLLTQEWVLMSPKSIGAMFMAISFWIRSQGEA